MALPAPYKDQLIKRHGPTQYPRSGVSCVAPWVVTLAIALAAGAGIDAAAADPLVSLTVTPSEITLITGASAAGTIVLANAATTEVKVLDLRALPSDPAVQATLASQPMGVVPSGGSKATDFSVTRQREGSGQSVIVRFVASLEQALATGTAAVEQVIVASMKVNVAAGPSLLTAKFEGTVGPINEFRPTETAMILSNPRDSMVTIETIEVTTPAGVRANVICPVPRPTYVIQPLRTRRITDCQFTIAPHSQELMKLALLTPDVVNPGSRSVVFILTARSTQGNVSAVEDVLTALPVNVDIFGEADILKFLGVPIFLLVPGVIVVAAALSVLSSGQTATLSGGNLVTTTVVFGLAAVASSLMMAELYPLLTSALYPGIERNYTRAYGFRDFHLAFGYSLVVGVVIGGLVRFFRWVIQLLPFAHAPTEDDDEMGLLERLARRGGHTTYPEVKVGGKRGFAIPARPGKALVIPGILVSMTKPIEGFGKEVDGHLKRNESKALFETIRAQRQAQAVLVRWDPSGAPRHMVSDPSLGALSEIVKVEPPPATP